MKRRLWLLAGVAFVLALTAALAAWQLRDEASGPRPDVVLGTGSHDGLDWVYGYNVGELEERPCFQLVIEGSPRGCGRYTQPVATMVVYHSSGGRPDGLVTAEGVVADEVARVECGTGAEPIGETHLFEMRRDEPRPVLCLATGDEIAGRQWFAFAFDARNRQLAQEEIVPRR